MYLVVFFFVVAKEGVSKIYILYFYFLTNPLLYLFGALCIYIYVNFFSFRTTPKNNHGACLFWSFVSSSCLFLQKCPTDDGSTYTTLYFFMWRCVYIYYRYVYIYFFAEQHTTDSNRKTTTGAVTAGRVPPFF